MQTLPMNKYLLLLLSLSPFFTQAETFLSLQVEDLIFEKGEAIPDSFDARRSYSRELRKWVTPATPYLRTQDAEESFLTSSVNATTQADSQQVPFASA